MYVYLATCKIYNNSHQPSIFYVIPYPQYPVKYLYSFPSSMNFQKRSIYFSECSNETFLSKLASLSENVVMCSKYVFLRGTAELLRKALDSKAFHPFISFHIYLW